MATLPKRKGPTGAAKKTPPSKQKGLGSDFGFGNPFRKPNKVLEGPVTTPRKDIKVDKKRGRPDRPLKGPVGAVFPLTSSKKRRGKAGPVK